MCDRDGNNKEKEMEKKCVNCGAPNPIHEHPNNVVSCDRGDCKNQAQAAPRGAVYHETPFPRLPASFCPFCTRKPTTQKIGIPGTKKEVLYCSEDGCEQKAQLVLLAMQKSG